MSHQNNQNDRCECGPVFYMEGTQRPFPICGQCNKPRRIIEYNSASSFPTGHLHYKETRRGYRLSPERRTW